MAPKTNGVDMSKTTIAAVAAILAIALAALVVTGCGSSDEPSSSQAESTDGAFLAEMISHHQSAIEMAKVAQKKADHPHIKQLADDIVAAQDAEIADMNEMHRRMFGESAMGADHGSLGLDDQMMGMSMSMESMQQLWSRREVQGMRANAMMSLMGLMTAVRVLPEDLYHRLMETDEMIPKGSIFQEIVDRFGVPSEYQPAPPDAMEHMMHGE